MFAARLTTLFALLTLGLSLVSAAPTPVDLDVKRAEEDKRCTLGYACGDWKREEEERKREEEAKRCTLGYACGDWKREEEEAKRAEEEKKRCTLGYACGDWKRED
ncbi:hypothetical protein DENSPDRAFT_844759 [Dentipellis sp. KUC8613]|nr:hypothetical protein DENSPDRAFT_844759 [Dentipellis sp. KUC8613]